MSNVMSPEVNNLLEQHSGKNQAFALFPGFGCLECRGFDHIFGSDRSTVSPLRTGVGVPHWGGAHRQIWIFGKFSISRSLPATFTIRLRGSPQG